MQRTRRFAIALAALIACAQFTVPAARGATATFPTHAPHVFPTADAISTAPAPAAADTAPLQYGGGWNGSGVGVTTGPPKVYLVFWGSQWGTTSTSTSLDFSNDRPGVALRLQALFNGIGTNGENWSNSVMEYCDGVARGATTCPPSVPHVPYPPPGVLAGVWKDTGAPAPAAAYAEQLDDEVRAAALHFGNATSASNRNAQYFVVSPSGTHPDGFNGIKANYCAEHAYASSNAGNLAFTNMPYILDMHERCGQSSVNGTAGVLDGVTIVAGHEYAETLTDMFPQGGWLDANGQENADKCAWRAPGTTGGMRNVPFATGNFPMQGNWSNAANQCLTYHGTTIKVAGSLAVSLTDDTGSSVLVGTGKSILGNKPFQLSSSSACINHGATPYGYWLECPSAFGFTVDLGDGDDRFSGNVDASLTVFGMAGNKDIRAGSRTLITTILTGDGNDHIELTAAGAGGNFVDAGPGNDFVQDDAGGNDTLRGGIGADTIVDKDGRADTINCGQNRNDPTLPDAQTDAVYRDQGLDTLHFCGNDVKH